MNPNRSLHKLLRIIFSEVLMEYFEGQCKKLRGKFINCYLCLQIHSLWS